MWEIVDDNGTIYSGEESEMLEQFMKMGSDRESDDLTLEEEDYDWDGDLRLIQVHQIYR